jgi:hypothetical protein
MTVIESPNRYDGRISSIRLIVIHDGETQESGTAAEGMANWFSRSSTRASSHTTHDSNSDIRCVYDDDTAWCAPGANADGLHLELAGIAAQTPAEWADPYSIATMKRGASQAAEWSLKYNIPPRWLTDAQLADGVTKGFTTHVQVTRVFKRSNHTDPGKSFPYETFMAFVIGYITGKVPARQVPPVKRASVQVPSFHRVLRYGSAGPDVIILQKRLRARGWRIAVDGDFGPVTRKIIIAFQREKGLGIDGIVGPVTWRKLWTAPVTR